MLGISFDSNSPGQPTPDGGAGGRHAAGAYRAELNVNLQELLDSSN
jgi:hypothetical protein